MDKIFKTVPRPVNEATTRAIDAVINDVVKKTP
jgi:hypothetical protein